MPYLFLYIGKPIELRSMFLQNEFKTKHSIFQFSKGLLVQ